ncbi:ribose transport system substrate-binding protein [Amycolatopsis arida]|uniref:Ribose transport system substrate-binding protein n=1 Tax=Amycolatopsis arida TaxID=587909 RepID=A0A1I6AQG4_9PSEU|nr:substrate-binding domain-containing protein [Amycolatopsis arida]TDX97620.1 ribose transport system substrate-binding protein [Amycolatopsis arida]SFQ70849.1 ribose transport system substrate-binding protein [Amycolatopsis arida]
MSRRPLTVAAIAGCLLLVSSACGTTSENSGQGSQPGQTGSSCQGPRGSYVIGMSQANVAEPYRQRMDDDIAQAAAAIPQFTVEFADAQQDNAKQVSDVENFLIQQVDLLIISPNEATPLTSVVKKVYDRGVPVVVLDRKVDGDSYTTFIGADNTEIGRQAGRHMAEQVLPDGGRIAEIRGLAGSTPARERSTGFAEGIEGSDIEIVAAADGDWLREKGQAQADAILKAHPDLQAVYAHNDPMAEGAYLAAKAAGRDQQLKFIGIDGLPIPSGGIKAVEAGRLSATFIYPTGGQEAIDAAKALLIDCQQVPKTQILPTQLVTQENATEIYDRANSG